MDSFYTLCKPQYRKPWQASSIGRPFRPPLWRWRKMAAFPLPAAILDVLISGFREWAHPRWRPEAEGPPFSSTSTMGVEKAARGLGWRQCRRRHLGSKMAAPQVTSGGRQDSHEDVPSWERGGPSPKTSRRRLKLFWKFFIEIQKSIWLLASPNHSRNGWGSCPLATSGKSISLHVSTPRSMKCGVDFGKHLLYLFLNCTLQYTRIIVEYSVIVGGSLVWLETNLNPIMTILLFSQFYRPSNNDRAVQVRGQFDSIKKVWCLGYRVQIMRRQYLTAQRENIKMVNWPDCGGVQIMTARKCNTSTIDSFTVGLSCHPTQLR